MIFPTSKAVFDISFVHLRRLRHFRRLRRFTRLLGGVEGASASRLKLSKEPGRDTVPVRSRAHIDEEVLGKKTS